MIAMLPIQFILLSLLLLLFVHVAKSADETQNQQVVDSKYWHGMYSLNWDVESLDGVLLDPQCTHIRFHSVDKTLLLGYQTVHLSVEDVEIMYEPYEHVYLPVDWWTLMNFLSWCNHHFPNLDTVRIDERVIRPFIPIPDDLVSISFPNLRFLYISHCVPQHPVIDLLNQRKLQIPGIERIILTSIRTQQTEIDPKLLYGFDVYTNAARSYTLLTRQFIRPRAIVAEGLRRRGAVVQHIQEIDRHYNEGLLKERSERNQRLVDRIAPRCPFVFFVQPELFKLTSLRGVHLHGDYYSFQDMCEVPSLLPEFQHLHFSSDFWKLGFSNSVGKFQHLFNILKNQYVQNKLEELEFSTDDIVRMDYNIPSEDELHRIEQGETYTLARLKKLSIGYITLMGLFVNHEIIKLPMIEELNIINSGSSAEYIGIKPIIRGKLGQPCNIIFKP